LRFSRLLPAVFPAVITITALTLSGCRTVGPDYSRPELPVPAGYSEVSPEAAVQAVPDAWWTLFGDPVLNSLVEEAFAANQDLAAAAARIEEARALLGITNADRYPQVTGSLDAGRTRQSTRGSFPFPPGFDPENDNFRIAAGISYDLDFWGRLRRSTEAARAELLASEEGRRNVALGLASEVAAAYFDLVAFDQQLRITRDTLGTRGESVRLQNLRFEAGTISGLDQAQAEAELASAEATVPALERLVRQTENRLGVLLGRFGGTVERGGELESLVPPAVPVGLPSQLLARRPDVLAAELRLIAANARIGVARAAYFPSIGLTGYAGTESNELSSLFSSGTFVWQAATSLLQPIFNAGRTRREVEASEARQRESLALYTQSLQIAFAEVEDALVARRTGVAEREALARQVEALARARRLAGLRYEAGESSYIEVLDSERTLFRAQLDLVNARRAELAASVDLFRALGGGWEEPVPAAADATAQAATQ
jgi:multidrug efflux system outer membrane protein